MRTPVLCQLPSDSRQFKVTGNPDDAGVVGIIERLGHYEPDVMLAIRSLLPPDAVCIDGGANVGVLSLAMALYAPAGRVYAFEPEAETFAYLCSNLALNGIKNVVPLRLGLWDEPTKKSLYFDGGGTAWAARIADSGIRSSAVETIDVISVDTWASEQRLDRLDLLKLDVEGAEPWALRGSVASIGRFRPILLIEFNPVPLSCFHGYHYLRLYDTLREMYPVITCIRPDGSRVWIRSRRHLDRLLAHMGVLNLVCLPANYATRWRAGREEARSVRDRFRLLAAYNALRPSPPAFLYDPSYRAAFLTRGPLRLRPGEQQTLTLRLRNTGKTWLSSEWSAHRVVSSYHWFNPSGDMIGGEGLRTPLPVPIGPRRTANIPLTVQGPTEPGRYELAFSLLQEQFAWCDQLRPDLAVKLPVTITANAGRADTFFS
jgi:FkbM family methyltransferase